MNRRVLLGAAVLLIATACGGGETPAPTSAPAPQPPADQPTEPPAQEGYQGGTVSDGGTISGTISHSGEVVGPIEVVVDKDQFQRAKHSYAQRWQVPDPTVVSIGRVGLHENQ